MLASISISSTRDSNGEYIPDKSSIRVFVESFQLADTLPVYSARIL